MKSTSIDLEQLVAERPFELLSQQEKAAVLAEMPEWEYQRLHQLLQRSKSALKKSPKPDPAIKQRLLEAMQGRQLKTKRPGLLVQMAQYKLPAWQVAAGLALLLTAHFALKESTIAVPQVETVYVHNTDTIYKEVAIPVADTASKQAHRRVNVKPSFAKRSLSTRPDPMEIVADSSFRPQGTFNDLPDTLPGFQFTIGQPSGRSANEMKELWQFLGDVY